MLWSRLQSVTCVAKNLLSDKYSILVFENTRYSQYSFNFVLFLFALGKPDILTRISTVVCERTQKRKQTTHVFKSPPTGFVCEANRLPSGEDCPTYILLNRVLLRLRCIFFFCHEITSRRGKHVCHVHTTKDGRVPFMVLPGSQLKQWILYGWMVGEVNYDGTHERHYEAGRALETYFPHLIAGECISILRQPLPRFCALGDHCRPLHRRNCRQQDPLIIPIVVCDRNSTHGLQSPLNEVWCTVLVVFCSGISDILRDLATPRRKKRCKETSWSHIPLFRCTSATSYMIQETAVV